MAIRKCRYDMSEETCPLPSQLLSPVAFPSSSHLLYLESILNAGGPTFPSFLFCGGSFKAGWMEKNFQNLPQLANFEEVAGGR